MSPSASSNCSCPSYDASKPDGPAVALPSGASELFECSDTYALKILYFGLMGELTVYCISD
jgi:hypothetical protein